MNNNLDQQRFRRLLDGVKRLRPKSVFSERTEESSASQYFQFYGYLSQQQNMMQDYVRTSTYQRAILGNTADFQVHIIKKKTPIIILMVITLFLFFEFLYSIIE